MDRQGMKDLVQAMYDDSLNVRDADAADRFWTKDMIWHGPAGLGTLHGLEEFKNKLLRPFMAAFPDYHAINEIVVVDEEQQMICAWGYYTGTHSAEWAGVPATGKMIRGGFTDFWRVEGDLLAENWVEVDVAGVLEQLGVLNLPETLPDHSVSS